MTRIKVSGKVFSIQNQDVIVFKINAPPYICIIKDYDFSKVREAESDNEKWKAVLSELHMVILNRSFELIKEDLVRLTGTLEFYELNCYKNFRTPASYRNGKIDPDILDKIGVQTFVYRLGGHCVAIKSIGDMGLNAFINMELSIGVLLRSCVLDCLYIMAWCNNPTLISAIASESFIRPLGKDVPDQVKSHFKDIADFFNTDDLDAIKVMGIKNILKILEGKPNIQWYENLYSIYSKYDHFSLIPNIAPKSPVEKLELVLLATHMIKHSLCSMLTMKSDDHHDKFQEILGVKNTTEDGINYSFAYD
ncbi:hypothetical protein [Dyadobacter chenhuakuii]|uniref:Uncharacterized protein n=1 Tax=Dyadobacter chenhuakuii TaxID=2909339 RepID=A0A9X1TWR6_9BACT|nr:hypothetical protein [Dyadobacter chenhuakuii]MCF2501367.1 hypothetical protein [Dyadobacter chenhuakuii]